MKILLVGGAGYVGGSVYDEVSKNKKNKIIVYDNLLYEDLYLKNCRFVYGDVRERKKLKPLLKWADVVVWMAAIVGDGACEINRSETIEINEKSVKWLANNFDKKIIYFSTCSVYGAQDNILDENSPTNPLSLYALTKLRCEKILRNKKAIIFRLGTLFGIGDIFSRVRMDLVLNVLVAKGFKEKKIFVFGGKQFRPLLHVKDVGRAVNLSLKSNKYGIYNLKLKNMKIIDLAEIILKKMPYINLKRVNTPFQDTRNYRVSDTKAQKNLKFYAKYSVEYGINQILNLVKENRIKDINLEKFINQSYLKKKI